MSQDTGGDVDEIPEEYLAFRTEEAGKAAREALRIRFSNFDEEDLNQSGWTKYKKTKIQPKQNISQRKMIKIKICRGPKKLFMCLIESRCISMTLSLVVLSLKVRPDMSFCPRVPLKQTSLGSRRSSILSEVKARGCHFDDTPLLTSSLSSLTCCYLAIVWWKSIHVLEKKNQFVDDTYWLWYFWRLW